MPRTAIILGGAIGVFEEAAAAQELHRHDIVVACNDAITRWPGELAAAVTFHAEQLAKWLALRHDAGYPAPERVFVRKGVRPAVLEPHRSALKAFKPTETESRFFGQSASGSSGLFAAKVALFDLGCDLGTCCGIPMAPERRNIVRQNINWRDAIHLRQGWMQALPVIKGRLRSMSGWTAAILGEPTLEWLRGE